MLVTLINRLLTHDEPSREKLISFAGKIVLFNTPPLSTRARINERGYLVEQRANVESGSDSDPKPDLTITLAVSAFPFALLGKERLLQEAHIEGNIALGNAFNTLFENVPLIVEQETEQWVGPVVAYNLSQSGQRLARGVKALQSSLARNATRALTEGELSPLPHPDELRSWTYDVNGVAIRVQALEQRIARLR